MQLVDIGNRLELMVDEYLLENFRGTAKLHYHQPTRREVVFPNENPITLEKGNGLKSGGFYHTVLQDGDTYRMYYSVGNYSLGERRRYLHYAESNDGIHWKIPSLGLIEFAGSKDNNIIWEEDLTPFIDENPACKPEERYKAIMPWRPVINGELQKRKLYAVSSPDGIHWQMMSSEPVITEGAFDSQNLAFWDSVRSEYRAYWREFFYSTEGKRYRGIKTATSSDFFNWDDGQWLYYPDAATDELYTNVINPYYRAPHIFVGFPARYVARSWGKVVEALPELERRKFVSEEMNLARAGSDVTDTLFMSSRDGINFNVGDQAFIRPGLRYQDNWFYGDNYTNWGIVTTPSGIEGVPDELSFYSTEKSKYRDKSKVLRRYTLRVDGFASIRASRHGGEVITCPLIFAGSQLVVNFSASAAGSMRVELQNTHGLPLEGFTLDDCVPVIGDDLERTVQWQGKPDLGSLAGTPVRMRIELVEVDLYSFQFKEKNHE